MKRKISMTILIIFVSFLAIYLGLRDTNKSNRDLYKLELKEEIKGNKFAIYVNNGDGYKEYNNKIWPNEYVFNSELSKCVDEYGKDLGNVLNFNEGTNTASVNTTQTAYCYLYFIYDVTLPTCSLTVSGNDIIWSSKSDNFTESNKLNYTINTNSNNPSSYDNLNSVGIGVGTYYGYVQDEVGNIGKCEIDIRNTKPVACTVTQENPIPIACTVTAENQIPIACTVTDTTGTPVYCTATQTTVSENCTYTTKYDEKHCTVTETIPIGENCHIISVSSSHGHCDVYCSNGGTYSDPSGVCHTGWCTQAFCGTYVNICSNGKPYDTSDECTSQLCSEVSYDCADGQNYPNANNCTSKLCSVTKYSCSNGGIYSTSSECTNITCSTNYSYTCSNGSVYNSQFDCISKTCSVNYTYSCSNNGVYNSREECTNKTCGTKYTYSCSNNQEYETKDQCASQTCGITCDAGYTQTGSYCYK